MLDLSKLVTWDYPFQMGTASDVFEDGFYRELVKTFPPVVLAQRTSAEKDSLKYSISPEKEAKQFYGFLKMAPAWQAFYEHAMSGAWLRYFELPKVDYFIRFEFSFMPWDDGFLLPHRDAPPKVLALVFPMTLEDRPEWGGFTEMLEPKEPVKQAVEPFEKFDSVLKAHFKPKAANFLVRSNKSWHGVRCYGPKGGLRKSITLNLVGSDYATNRQKAA